MDFILSPKNKLTYIIGLSWNNGAVTKYFKTLAIKLAERGHRVILVADKQDNEFSNYNDCITFYRFPSTTPTHLIDFLFVLKLIIRNKPNCVIGVFRAVNIVILAGWLLGNKEQTINKWKPELFLMLTIIK